MAIIAAVLFNIGLLVAFGWQSWRQKRRTGSTGFVGLREVTSSLQRWSGIGFVLTLVLDEIAVIGAAAGVVPVAAVPVGIQLAGLALMLAGLAIVLVSQVQMGDAWRIGVAERERTSLVTDGIFRIMRNPIFSGMALANLGALLMVPSWLMFAGLLLLALTIDIQVRHLEEPYLERVHGDAYRRYRATSGRYVPLWRTRRG
jgi:protein-S-isoprenylcysteine O-methyltransferase Ste14